MSQFHYLLFIPFYKIACNAFYLYRTCQMILEAKGIFKERILETFNPIYWIESAIFLPKHTLMYLGIKPDNIILKLLQLAWFILAGAYSLLLVLYPDAFRLLIERLPSSFR